MRLAGTKFDSKKRWVAYLDLLGTKARMSTSLVEEVAELYLEAIELLEKQQGKVYDKVGYTWFSDSYLLFSSDDSAQSFVQLESLARTFQLRLLIRKVPSTGAISCGEMLVDSQNRIFVGMALNDASSMTDAQDWIGMVLTDSAVTAMEKLGLPVGERLNYAFCEDLPIRKKHRLTIGHARVNAWACVHGQRASGRNIAIEALQKMKATANSEAQSKYANAIKFIKANRLDPVKDKA